ncbi:outer membrane lipoprotein chaperone LolA [Amphritea sp. 2_MG-2023]|uniref:outer membrane lipoprotein chaperone LolA n=1 Tax=Amphritea TaxID=515417 RepID=UPI001C06F3F2|nr:MULTISPECIES: outer membrane lipoprotein chaperone LolA [Amphritea]MBU2964383.1 outer membrane lipoprotein chaperone LolA [Amphritea atlantica]MDO6417711.1 outer membrane lipoprotein chaperone LolA [Amphritea sp. 2_MG-2023]
MVFKKIAAVALLGCSLSFSALADIQEGAGDRLNSLLATFDSFSADFDQVSGSDDSRRIESSKGTLLLAKPNRFRWIAKQPFPQTLVSDGETLWIYDPDLEQATERKVSEGDSGVPALILNGQIEQLKSQYKIRLLQEKTDSQLFELLPLKETEVFTRIRLLFTDGVIKELQMEDSLGQKTSILFQNQKLNPEYQEDTFTFTPPEGTDVIVESSPESAN